MKTTDWRGKMFSTVMPCWGRNDFLARWAPKSMASAVIVCDPKSTRDAKAGFLPHHDIVDFLRSTQKPSGPKESP